MSTVVEVDPLLALQIVGEISKDFARFTEEAGLAQVRSILVISR